MTIRPTEQRNPTSRDIDLVGSSEVLTRIVSEDLFAVGTVACAIPQLSTLVDEVEKRLLNDGRLHYFGAGASGRLAVLDATELRPTYGISPDLVTAHFPGGASALIDSSIDMEDSESEGRRAAQVVTANDVVIGISASGSTPYVAGAFAIASSVGAATALVTNTPNSLLSAAAEIVVELDTGAEVIMGSTRMKAGTATKVALNAFSTALMIRLGKTYSNLMVEMVSSNDKLRDRAVRILGEATGETESKCQSTLEEADNDLSVALVRLLTGLSVSESATALAKHGSVRAAVASK